MRHLEAESLGCSHVDDEVEFGRLLDRDVAGLGAAHDLVDVFTRASEQVGVICSIGDQASCFDVSPFRVHRRDSCRKREGVNPNPISIGEGV